MRTDVAILIALSKAPRTVEQIRAAMGETCTPQHVAECLRDLQACGLVYICDHIPPRACGRATNVYALNGHLHPGLCKDAPPWSQLPEDERRARREDVWGGQ